jgi:hypothetical protein
MWPCIVTNFLVIKPTRCTNLSNLFWKLNSTFFGQFLFPSPGVVHCTLSNGMSYRCIPSWSCCSSKAVYKPVWHIPLLSVQWITPDDGQRNFPKHVEFHFQNKFERQCIWLVLSQGNTVVCFTCIDVSSHTDACKTHHTAHTTLSLRMNPRGTKHVADKRN